MWNTDSLWVEISVISFLLLMDHRSLIKQLLPMVCSGIVMLRVLE